jgi:glycosyltransferase involved in cell wall biosynthesis
MFKSFFQAGFECSTHVLPTGKRLDLVASTGHDRFAAQDFARLRDLGILTAREGLRWHLIEAEPGHYDFSSVHPILTAARQHDIQIIWDLLHFGWPGRLDVYSEDWLEAFADFARAFGRFLRTEATEPQPFIAPVNEISFLSWAGGDRAYLNPYATGRGAELKAQLVRGYLRASDALRMELENVRLVSPEPVIHIVGDPNRPDDVREAAEYRSSMFEAWDMIAGRVHPELEGAPHYLDVIGINYYDRNQWWNHGETIRRHEKEYRPFREILQEVFERYQRPMFIAETGTENQDRPDWFAYVCQETLAAIKAGVPVHGICLYPILNHPGWDDDRHCYNGLWDYPNSDGTRELYLPLADEIARQQLSFKEHHVNLNQPDLLCLSHLRWDFVFQRPQHLMSRFARQRRVYYVEEPIYDSTAPSLQTYVCPQTGVTVVTPHLTSRDDQRNTVILSQLLGRFTHTYGIDHPMVWFYTPMALEFFPDSIDPSAVIYDCMDELSMFRGAPDRLQELEQQLLQFADVVFTGGASLFEAKCGLHPQVHAFPSGVDVSHFATARHADDKNPCKEKPRIGYAGVIDERMNLNLIEGIARLRPDWQIVMIGPTAKIDPAELPRAANIHWLGRREYSELPGYFAGWDVGIIPFALNDATRFISPTKTPEYLAAGLPVVSTPIRDVVRPYGELGLARIADTPEEFIRAAEHVMTVGMCFKWRERADEFLQTMSWDSVWSSMNRCIHNVLEPLMPEQSALSTAKVEVSASV